MARSVDATGANASRPGTFRCVTVGYRCSAIAAEPSMSASDDDQLLTAQEAAALLGVRPATMYQWAYQRRLPCVKLFGLRGALRFRRGDIRALIARSTRPPLATNG
jgi:excisionase family DNA binding protein